MVFIKICIETLLSKNIVEYHDIRMYLLDSYCMDANENWGLLYFGNGKSSEADDDYSYQIFWKLMLHLTTCMFFFYCRRMPSLLEYLSYNCNFMGILAGPLCSYKDYITFIEGRSYHMTQSGGNGKEEILYERTEPSPNVRSCDLSGAFIACID